MKKIYFLATCDTCQRIMNELDIDSFDFDQQEIKTEPITPAQLDEMKKMAGSYGALFNRRAQKYKALNLKDKKLSEKDYRRLILQEYTFLKRPVIILNDQIFIGNSKATVFAAKQALHGQSVI